MHGAPDTRFQGFLTFAAIFDTGEIAGDSTCAEGFMSSNAEGRAKCLAVKDDMETVASRLETRRYDRFV